MDMSFNRNKTEPINFRSELETGTAGFPSPEKDLASNNEAGLDLGHISLTQQQLPPDTERDGQMISQLEQKVKELKLANEI